MFYRPHKPVHAPHSDVIMTKQEFKDECDINRIIKTYQKSGILTHINSHAASFQDLPDSFDYQESLNTVMAAQAAFEDLPSKVRDRFGNDPQRFLEAFADPEQTDYLREVGLLKPLPEDGSRQPQAPSGSAPVPTPSGSPQAPQAPSEPEKKK